jgi:hypothetical protein
MDVMLRRNVVYRDWRNGIDKYRFAGLVPENVIMNEYTLHMLMEYFIKNNHWVNVKHNPRNVYDVHGTLISSYYSHDVYVEGIKIVIDSSTKNEIMRAVW